MKVDRCLRSSLFCTSVEIVASGGIRLLSSASATVSLAGAANLSRFASRICAESYTSGSDKIWADEVSCSEETVFRT